MVVSCKEGFWGITLHPGQPREFSLAEREVLHLKMASLGDDLKDEQGRSVVNIRLQDQSLKYALVALMAGRSESCQINATFMSGEQLLLEVSGKNAVHLTGNFLTDYDENIEQEWGIPSYMLDEQVVSLGDDRLVNLLRMKQALEGRQARKEELVKRVGEMEGTISMEELVTPLAEIENLEGRGREESLMARKEMNQISAQGGKKENGVAARKGKGVTVNEENPAKNLNQKKKNRPRRKKWYSYRTENPMNQNGRKPKAVVEARGPQERNGNVQVGSIKQSATGKNVPVVVQPESEKGESTVRSDVMQNEKKKKKKKKKIAVENQKGSEVNISGKAADAAPQEGGPDVRAKQGSPAVEAMNVSQQSAKEETRKAVSTNIVPTDQDPMKMEAEVIEVVAGADKQVCKTESELMENMEQKDITGKRDEGGDNGKDWVHGQPDQSWS